MDENFDFQVLLLKCHLSSVLFSAIKYTKTSSLSFKTCWEWALYTHCKLCNVSKVTLYNVF